MPRITAVSALIALCAGLAPGIGAADELALFNSDGAPIKVDTAKVEGCKIVFDGQGQAFELCKLQRVEMRPPTSTRMRPGQSAQRDRASVVYTKTSD